MGVFASAPVRKEISVDSLLSAYAHILYLAHLSMVNRRLIGFKGDVKLFPCSHQHLCYMPYLLHSALIKVSQLTPTPIIGLAI